MAFIDSIRKGQTAMVCQLCENDPQLKWKCQQCGLMMCQRCRDKVHPKFPSAADHSIIDIKDISEHQEEQKPDFSNLKCSVHTGQNCCLYCKPCSELVCPLCIAQTHNKHEMTEIGDGYKIQIEKIRDAQDSIHEGIHNLSKEEEDLSEIKSMEDCNYKKSKQDILKYKQTLISTIEKYCDKLLNDLEQQWLDICKKLDDEERRIENTKETLLQQNDEVNDLCQSYDALKVFSSHLLVESMKAKIKPVKTSLNRVPKFVSGDMSKVLNLDGKLETVSGLLNTDFKVVEEFETNSSRVTNLVVSRDSSLWINDQKLKLIQHLIPIEGHLHVKINFNYLVHDMTFTRDSDILLSTNGSTSLQIISFGTEDISDSVYNVSPLEPVGVHVTQDNKIIIGAVEKGSYWQASGIRKLIILDSVGQQEKVFQFDKNNKALFTLPIRIASICNDIGVVDRISRDGWGRIVILDQSGQVKDTYSGHSKINNEDNPFTPWSIMATPSDNFLVTDFTNHTLHILTCDGEIITYYNTNELGIKLPASLSFSHTGHLYIGCDTFENSDKKAMIFKIDDFVW